MRKYLFTAAAAIGIATPAYAGTPYVGVDGGFMIAKKPGACLGLW